MPHIFGHLYKALPDVPCGRLFTLGVLCAHCPCGTLLAQIGSTLVFPVAVTVCDRVMQRFVFRADHIVKVFIVHIGIPGMVAVFGFGACIGRGQNPAAFKDSFADPRCFVGTVSSNNFVFGIMQADIIVQGVKGYAVVNISGSNVYT